MAQIKVPVQLDEAAIEAWFDQISGQTSWEAALVELLREVDPRPVKSKQIGSLPSRCRASHLCRRSSQRWAWGLTASLVTPPVATTQTTICPRLKCTASRSRGHCGQKHSGVSVKNGRRWILTSCRHSSGRVCTCRTMLLEHLDDRLSATSKVTMRQRHSPLSPRSSGSLGDPVALGCSSFSTSEQRVAGGLRRTRLPYRFAGGGILDPSHGLGSSLRCWRAAPVRTFVAALHGSIVELGEGHSALILLSAIYLAVGIRSERQSEPTGE